MSVPNLITMCVQMSSGGKISNGDHHATNILAHWSLIKRAVLPVTTTKQNRIPQIQEKLDANEIKNRNV